MKKFLDKLKEKFKGKLKDKNKLPVLPNEESEQHKHLEETEFNLNPDLLQTENPIQEVTASHEDSPPLPPSSEKSHDRTQEIRIDPAQLQALSENIEDEDETDSTFQTMAIPKLEKEKWYRQFINKAWAGVAPFRLKVTQKFQVWQKKRVADGQAVLSWDKIFTDLFGKEQRQQIHHFFIIASIATCAYGMGKLTSYLIKGVEERIKPVALGNQQYKPVAYPIAAIKSANLFNTQIDKNQGIETQQKNNNNNFATKVCSEASKGTTLPLELTNTIVLQDTVKSVASVAIRGDRDIINVREGEKIKGMAEVGRINRLNLIIKNLSSGECEFIESKELQVQDQKFNIVGEHEGRKLIQSANSKDIQNEGNKFKIKKDFRDKMLENISEVLTQARAIQIKNSDGSLAFKMTEIIPGSIYSQLNIKDEDIISKINGKEISTLNDIMSMFGSIKTIDQLSITVMRDGTEIEMDYKFE